MIIPENLLTYIKEESKKIKHGKIIININEINKHVDVTVENTERFRINNYYHDG